MRFKAAVKKLESLIDYERKPAYEYNLDDYRRFLESIGSPHERLRPVILIAGTKGKGSTGMILSSILAASGKKVGFFNSPHLIDVRERIRINNRKIPKGRFAEFVKEILPRMEHPSGIRSYFEVLVTIAILYFLAENVDYSIFEVGMGGRKDATNVLAPIISIITRIGHDHKRFLGSNLRAIGREKAGIIHDQAPVVISHQKPGVKQLIKKIASERNSPFYYAEDYIKAEVLNQDYQGCHLLIRINNRMVASEFSLLGDHQIENLKAAITTCRILGVDLNAVKKGIRQVRAPARIQVFDVQPRIIIDTAHNPQSFNALAKVLPQIITGRLFVIFGVSAGKDWSILRKKILPWSYRTIITKSKLPRAKRPSSLAKSFPGKVVETVGESIMIVLEVTQPIDTILITGSFFIAGEAIEILSGLGLKVQKP